MTVTVGLNMRLTSSLSSNMFWGRISIHGQFRLYKQVTSCKNQPALGSSHCACHRTIELLWSKGWIP
uniref:SFRICE_039722 n=1 Tax=Spodoptera frugiperda TaxID=7108 RepID=A0A2H1WT87_SPOFR